MQTTDLQKFVYFITYRMGAQTVNYDLINTYSMKHVDICYFVTIKMTSQA